MAELVLDYLQVLVWPAVVLFIAIRFRRQLEELVGRLRKADALGVSAEFDKAVTRAAGSSALAIAEATSEPTRPMPESSDNGHPGDGAIDGKAPLEEADPLSAVKDASSFDDEILDRLLALAVSNRILAIDRAWAILERVINNVDDYVEFTKPNVLGIKEYDMWDTITELERLKVIEPEIRTALKDLFTAARSAWSRRHDMGDEIISLAAATTFITTAYRLADTITTAGQHAYYKVHPV